MPSDEYDRDRPPRTPKLLLKIETADARQAHIEDKTTGTIRRLFSPELFRRFKSNRVQTSRFKKPLDRCTYTRIVVNYVHCWDSCRCHLRPLGTSRPRCGRERRIYPVSTLNCFYGKLSHSPCAEFSTDGPPGDAHSFISFAN